MIAVSNFSVDVNEAKFSIEITLPRPLSVEGRNQVLRYLAATHGNDLRRYRFIGHQKLHLVTKSNEDSFKVLEAYADRLLL